jgi:hypothetical protein
MVATFHAVVESLLNWIATKATKLDIPDSGLNVLRISILFIFFFMPIRAFIGIVSDIILVEVIFLPFIAAYFIIAARLDPTIHVDVDWQKANELALYYDRRQKLLDVLRLNFILIALTIGAKAFCTSIANGPFELLSHVVSFAVGCLIIVCVDKLWEMISVSGILVIRPELHARSVRLTSSPELDEIKAALNEIKSASKPDRDRATEQQESAHTSEPAAAEYDFLSSG